MRRPMSLIVREKLSQQAKAPAPPVCKPLRDSVGQTLSSANPARSLNFSRPLILAMSLCGIAQHAASSPAPAGAFATNSYRNLFREAGHPQKEISAKIQAAFQQLFHGDPETQTVYYPAVQNANDLLAYLSDIHNHDVRSEGMSYGMMNAVQMDKKAEFDSLWNWAKTYMY